MSYIPVFSSPVASAIPFDNSTNGFIATDVQAAIEESRFNLQDSEITATATATTSSSTDAVLTTMTVTPIAGTYMVWFNGDFSIANAGSVISISLYVDAAQQAATLRKLSYFDGGTLSATSARGVGATQMVVTLNGTQVLTLKWSISSGTGTAAARSLMLLRVGV